MNTQHHTGFLGWRPHRLTRDVSSLLLLCVVLIPAVAFGAGRMRHRVDATAEAARFLAPYVNSTEEALEAGQHKDDFWPVGPNMWNSFYYYNTPALRQKLKDAGFTMVGPYYEGSTLPYVDEKGVRHGGNMNDTIHAAADGFKIFCRLYMGGGKHDRIVARIRGEKGGKQALRDRLKANILRIVNDETRIPGESYGLNDAVVAWYLHPEECHTRKRKDGSIRQSIQEFVEFKKLAHEAVQLYDPKKRPLIESDIHDTSNSERARYMPYLGGVLRQSYFIMRNFEIYFRFRDKKNKAPADYWPTDPSREPSDALQYRNILQNAIVHKSMVMAKCTPKPNDRERPVIACLSAYSDPGAFLNPNREACQAGTPGNEPTWRPGYAPRRTDEWLQKCIRHDVWSMFLKGVHGISVYAMLPRPHVYKQETLHVQHDAYLTELGIVNKEGFDRAFLWGRDMKGSSRAITLSQSTHAYDTYNWDSWGRPKSGAVSLEYADIQHGKHRFVVVVNSHPQNDADPAVGRIGITLSGLPRAGCKVVRYELDGTKTDIVQEAGQLTFTLNALQAGIFRIEAAPAY